ncbi:MAG: hypothetical protein JXQ27_02000, partial [Acidobacteria bacterium]|nr:hypothetical protein [Acidobacteriota bacterium]
MMMMIRITLIIFVFAVGGNLWAVVPAVPAGQLIAGGEARVNDVWMPRGATVFTGDEVTAG